ncbi:uncharacterized protein LOC127350180 [Dicentrarchus labrax]|uniref:uncharacterized protein LOC127350180 n=1 Tax=Dicentrarchus labrax TaxID=13489 RepID=UPI0021F54AC2|nr:uncharacterized protein LOC127350180 [Dicentrarchus labrax]
MWKEKKTVKLQKHEPDTCPMIMGDVKDSVPRIRTVKSKEKIKATASNRRSLTTCETSGNIMRLCVNLMPVLAAAKEPVEEEEGKEEEKSKKGPETRNNNDPSVEETLDPCGSDSGLDLDAASDTKLPPTPRVVLPPLNPKPAPECQKTKRCLTPLPPISSSEQTGAISSNFTVKSCRGDELVAEQAPDSRAWMDNTLFSKPRSAEFLLPDISLCSLDALLQTVTKKLGRKRTDGDEGPWRRVTAVFEQRLRGESVGQQVDTKINEATETSERRSNVNRPKPTLILTMTKKNLLTSTSQQ